jgi:tetratricopeptide repeat protein 21B
MRLWRSLGLVLDGRSGEVLKDLKSLEQDALVGPATLAVLVHAQSAAMTVDHGTVRLMEDTLTDLEASASDEAKVELARVYWALGSVERSISLLEDVTMLHADHLGANALLGWVLATQLEMDPSAVLEGESPLEDALVHFNVALGHNPDDPDAEAALGKVRALRLLGRRADAELVLAPLVVRCPWLVPAETERMRLWLKERAWESVTEAAHKSLATDEHNAEAYATLALASAAQEGACITAARYADDLEQSLSVSEPRQWTLRAKAGHALALLATHDEDLAAAAARLADQALRLAPSEPGTMMASAWALMVTQEYARARVLFDRTCDVDPSLGSAMVGGALALALEGRNEEARVKVDGLLDAYRGYEVDHDVIAVASGPTGFEVPVLEGLSLGDQAALLYAKALVWFLDAAKSLPAGEPVDEDNTPAHRVALLEAAMAHMGRALRTGEASLDVVAMINPWVGLNVTWLMLQHTSGEVRSKTEAPPKEIELSLKHLQRMASLTPGHPGLLVLSGLCLHLAGKRDGALKKAHATLQACPELAEAHLLVVRIHLDTLSFDTATKALDQAVLQNYKVRNLPQYQTARARLASHHGDHKAALKDLAEADKMPGMRGRFAPVVPGSRSGMTVTMFDRCGVLLGQADAYMALGKKGDASQAIQRAAREARGSAEEDRVALAALGLKIASGNVMGAIKEMEAVPPESPVYLRTRVALAKVFLEQRRDREGYIRLYRELAERFQDKASWTMFGEAMLSIQEPRLAAPAFIEALKRDPRDAALAMRTGSALVATHDFNAAIDYYRRAASSDAGNYDLQMDLADLLMRVGRAEEAFAVLDNVTEDVGGAGTAAGTATAGSTGTSVAHLTPTKGPGGNTGVSQRGLEAKQVRAKALRMRADFVGREGGRGTAASQVPAWEEALSAHEEVLEMLVGGHPDLVAAERDQTAAVGHSLADALARAGRRPEAHDALTKAVQRGPGYAPAVLQLARWKLAAGHLEAVVALVERMAGANDRAGQEASLLLAQVALLQGDHAVATGRISVALGADPGNWMLLYAMMDMLRRTGKLSEAPALLDAARRSTPRAVSTAGYLCCAGLHHKYTNRPTEALKNFFQARGDPNWGEEALCAMLDMKITPLVEAIWAAAGDDEDALPDNFAVAYTGEALDVCQQLLHLSRPRGEPTLRLRVWEAHVSLLSPVGSTEAERGLEQLVDVVQVNKEHVPALLAMATGFIILRQKPKARNQLKRISKMPFDPEYGDAFEQAWLCLAGMYFAGGKFDMATELCQKALKYNQGCAAAWDMMGQILEKEGAFQDAADHYAKAWELTQMSNPASGYRLAFNYLKAGRAVEAMRTSHQVLDAFPDYVEIRTEVLQRAWSLAKTGGEK